MIPQSSETGNTFNQEEVITYSVPVNRTHSHRRLAQHCHTRMYVCIFCVCPLCCASVLRVFLYAHLHMFIIIS